MSRVNPPPHLKVPQRFIADKETRDYLENLEFIVFQLWKRVGGGNDAVATGNEYNTKSQASINAINDRIGSGDPLTWDETGFTWDSTNFTFDQTEA